jgi:hypothetical protein
MVVKKSDPNGKTTHGVSWLALGGLLTFMLSALGPATTPGVELVSNAGFIAVHILALVLCVAAIAQSRGAEPPRGYVGFAWLTIGLIALWWGVMGWGAWVVAHIFSGVPAG